MVRKRFLHRKTPPRPGLVASLALLLALCLCLACGERKPPLNLLVIGVDTLRPDHLGCYGYDRSTSPNIDEIASRGVVFEHVVAPSPWTLPSFATVFTSLYPSQHGANGPQNGLRCNLPTLATVLQAEGYATGAIINAPYLKAQYGLDEGFESYWMTPREGRIADGTTRDALEWIDENSDRPFFMFAHYYDPHIPYEPPAPYDSLFDPGYNGRITCPYYPKGLPRFRNTGFHQMESLRDADWQHVKALYDGEIAFTDLAVGGLMKGLEERGLATNTLVVFLSDHGEEFFEHHGFEHGHSLYDELIKVPLIFSLPGELPEGTRIPRQVRLLDVKPTILDMLGFEPSAELEGVSLLPLMSGSGGPPSAEARLLPPEIAFSEALLYGDEKKSVSAYPWKLIYNTESDEVLYFNLSDDPDETGPVSDESTGSLRLLEQALYRTMLGISDTWFLEMAGGETPHVFDLGITCQALKGPGDFKFCRIIDSEGSILTTEAFGFHLTETKLIEIRELEVKEPLILAFRPVHVPAPIELNLRIDGRPAIQSTFIGETMARPITMPFVEEPPNPESGNTGLGNPAGRPDAPYFLLWHYRSRYQEGPSIKIDEETERELRALGYIQ